MMGKSGDFLAAPEHGVDAAISAWTADHLCADAELTPPDAGEQTSPVREGQGKGIATKIKFDVFRRVARQIMDAEAAAEDSSGRKGLL